MLNSSLFQNYWTDYINQCWSKYVSTPLTIDTQAQWGTVTGITSNDRSSITFGSVGSIRKPTATDIFGADSGAFAPQATNTAELLNIGARIDAAINRSTLLSNANQPDAENSGNFYTNAVTNHYARIVHQANVDGRGYCFPYDDVSAATGGDQSGFVSDGAPVNLLVTVGGGNAFAKREEPGRRAKREVRWVEDVKIDPEIDLEMGQQRTLRAEMEMEPYPKPKIFLPPFIERAITPYFDVSSLKSIPNRQDTLNFDRNSAPRPSTPNDSVHSST